MLKTHRIAHSRNSGKYLFIIFMTLLQYLTVGIGTAGTDGIPTAGGDKHPHMPDRNCVPIGVKWLDELCKMKWMRQ